MLSLSLLLVAISALRAQAQGVAGIGSSSAGLSVDSDLHFDMNVYASTIGSIISSLDDGPNRTVQQALPVNKLYGVNMGNWLVSEPWMSPNAWSAMGGQSCSDCSTCRQSEWSLATYLGRAKTNSAFKQHWQSWLTQADVDGIVAAKLNTIRIPLPFWIIEDIVDTISEPYAQGGLDELIRGLEMFKAAGLNVILDHHALPGVAAVDQMFAGNCTSNVQFYNSPNDYNYKRAVTWSIVMTYLSHTHPAFSTVFTLEAVNEPVQNAQQTPGLGRFETAFVLGVRAIEHTLGINCDNTTGNLTDPIALPAFNSAMPIIQKLSAKYGIKAVTQPQCLTTQFMNQAWQYNNPANPTDAAHGPQLYDNHLYFNFGGVAPQATEQSYMQTICKTNRVADSAKVGNAPLYCGEWSLATAFSTTNDFLQQWGDAQKLAWATGAGWVFWNWKLESTNLQWSYRDALNAGIFTADPAAYFNANVCAPYLT